jgi:structural maintenance of chromosome 1
MTAGTEICFERKVFSNNTSTYHVSGNTITESVYKDALRGIGVDTRSHNFLVFQGDVQKLADKEPLHMLKYFEEFSGSDEFKD